MPSFPLCVALLILFCGGIIGATATCPFNFTIIQKSAFVSHELGSPINEICKAVRQELNLLVAERAGKTGLFTVSSSDGTDKFCLSMFKAYLSYQGLNLDIESNCNIDASVLSGTSSACSSMQSITDYQERIEVGEIQRWCRGQLDEQDSCSSCRTAVQNSLSHYPQRSSLCLDYSNIYAGGIENIAGLNHANTVACLFYPGYPTSSPPSQSFNLSSTAKTVLYILAAFFVLLAGALVLRCMNRNPGD